MKKADQLTTEYLYQRGLYNDFAEEIKGILSQLLLGTDIKIYSISARAKDPAKLREKIIKKQKEGKKYEILTDIEDLAGVRVVPYLESQKQEIANLIYKEFEDANPGYEDKNNPNGYRGIHLVLSLNSARAELPEYRCYKDLKCEVQISSALYHTWSEIEHDIIYKSEEDKEKLKTLGLDQIEESFQKIMAEHIEQASIQFDHLYKKHKEILEAGAMFSSNFLEEIKLAKTNEELISFINIADRFSHKKPSETISMVETMISLPPLDPKVLGEIGSEKVYGKNQQNILTECSDILRKYHIRYYDVPKILTLLFKLVQSSDSGVSSGAISALDELVSYNATFLEKYKTIYPQVETLKFIKDILPKDRAANFKFISKALDEILSTETEAHEMTAVDQLTFRSGSLSQDKNLERLRHEGIDFITELLKKTTAPKDRLELVKILCSAFYPPSSGPANEGLIKMLVDDSKIITKILKKVIFSRNIVKDYTFALEVEETLNYLLQNKEFQIPEIQGLLKQLHGDPEYLICHTLVGDIPKFKAPGEQWDEAEKRRSDGIQSAVERTDLSNINDWHSRLEKFTRALKDEVLDEWQYAPLKTYITELTKSKPGIAFKLFEIALKNNSSLAVPIFVTAFLDALRGNNFTTIWDNFVEKIITKKTENLTSSIVYSLNIRKEHPITYIRKKDIEIVTNIVHSEKPFNYNKAVDSRLRHSVIGTLVRIYKKSPRSIEGLIIEEISNHPDMINVYFSDLPFSSHRGYMTWDSWTKKGKAFMSSQLVKISGLSWHTQEMMLEIYKPTLKPILDIFMARIKKDQSTKREGRYEAIPHDFNPELQKHIATHADYTEEMGIWLGEMTPKWSKYNWDVSHFIQRIGSDSYQTILRSLIKKGGKSNLQKATYALQGLDQPDFDICMEIAGKTDDKKILDKLSSVMYATGVVTGEDGLAKAMKAKAELMGKYLRSRNKRIKNFATRMKKYFTEVSQQESVSAVRRRRFRELDFEG